MLDYDPITARRVAPRSLRDESISRSEQFQESSLVSPTLSHQHFAPGIAEAKERGKQSKTTEQSWFALDRRKTEPIHKGCVEIMLSINPDISMAHT
jgi:hypothetical protein